MAPAPPAVPEAELDARGWTRTDDRSEIVFEGLGVTVESRTLVYEDEALRRRVTDAGGPDRIWRFLFVSRLEMTPQPMFGTHAAIRPHVLKESKQAFARELNQRGIERIESGETERIELSGDRQARLTPYRGVLSVGKEVSGGPKRAGCSDNEDEESKQETKDGGGNNGRNDVAIVGRLALWYDDGFRIAGCAGPNGSIGGLLDVETDDESLLSLIRTVA